MDLFARFQEWKEYAASKLSESEIDEADALAQLKYHDAQSTIDNWWHEDTKAADKVVTLAKAKKVVDEAYQEALDHHQSCYAKRKLLQVMFDKFEGRLALISRELTRRTNSTSDRRK